jgi:hypothetical protein
MRMPTNRSCNPIQHKPVTYKASPARAKGKPLVFIGGFDPRARSYRTIERAGMLVDAVSKSRFWNATAMFVIEDDAQNGPDHVDSHRAPAFVISPWVKKGTVNSTMYTQASVLRTMEIILGLRPMTTYDAGARPMFSVFANAATPGPYTLEKPQTPLDTRNPAKSPTAARSLRMNFKDADDIDEDELNAILWAAIKGPNAPLPVPVRSRFSR